MPLVLPFRRMKLPKQLLGIIALNSLIAKNVSPLLSVLLNLIARGLQPDLHAYNDGWTADEISAAMALSFLCRTLQLEKSHWECIDNILTYIMLKLKLAWLKCLMQSLVWLNIELIKASSWSDLKKIIIINHYLFHNQLYWQ